MTSSDFQPDRLNVEEILTRRFYRIPRFQRPYSWESSQVDEFWEDVFVDNTVGYFIGPMVGWRRTKDSPHANVVDGQQRLTTITIALAVIRDAYADLGQADLAAGVQMYIERRDRNNETHFVLQPEDKAPYLNNGILKYPRDESKINARVLAAGAWRGLHSVGVVDSIEAINGIGHAAVMCDPEFRGVLAAHGYTLDPETGEVAQLTPYAGSFSARAAQITAISTATRRSGAACILVRSPGRRCGGPGTGVHGHRPDRTRSHR